MRIPSLQRSFSLGALALAALCATGLAAGQTATTTATGTTAASGAMGQHADAKIARSDSAFLKQAAQNGNAEIEASKLAVAKSGSPQVKTFAQQMIDDHTKVGDELKTLASSKGVEVSDKPSIAQSAKIKLLDAMSGASFDKRYASMIGVTAHRDTVKLFQKASANAKDADVKAFASKTLPALQQHLEMAQSLKSTTAGAKS